MGSAWLNAKIIEPPATYNVHGAKATSYEANFAWALDVLKVPFIFQYQLFGGRRLRGGLILDFLCLTVPLSTGVFVNGDFWHGGEGHQDSTLKQKALIESEMRGSIREVIVLWGQDTETKQAALQAAKRELHL
jgi:hypothetical protein